MGTKAQEAEVSFETSIMEGKMAMEQASANVDSCVHKETIALEKFKAAKTALVDAQKKVIEKKLVLGDEDKALTVLSTEGEKNKKEAELIQAKQDAVKAKEEAKKAYQEAMAKAKEVAEEMKAKRSALAIADDPEAAAKAKEAAERAAEEEKARKEARTLGKEAGKDLRQEVKALEKERVERDKKRAQAFKLAAGLAKAKKRLALGDGSAASPAKVGNAKVRIDLGIPLW